MLKLKGFEHSHITTTMFLVKLEDVTPLSDAVFLFNQLSLEADVKFTHNMFSLTVSNASIRFIIKLDIWDELFAEYSVDPNQCWRISLSTFQKSLWDGGSYSSMTFLMHETRSRMVLEFHNSGNILISFLFHLDIILH